MKKHLRNQGLLAPSSRSTGAVPRGAFTSAWQFEVALAESGVTATVEERKGMDVIRARYSEEDRQVFGDSLGFIVLHAGERL